MCGGQTFIYAKDQTNHTQLHVQAHYHYHIVPQHWKVKSGMKLLPIILAKIAREYTYFPQKILQLQTLT